MKLAPLFLLALSATMTPLPAEAITLQLGQSIGIDFGSIAPDNHFNFCDPSNPAGWVNGSLPFVIDTTGATVEGIGISFAGEDVVSSGDGTTQDFANYTGFTLVNIQSAVSGYNLRGTFTGLDPQQRFTLEIVCSYSPMDVATEFIVNGIHILTDSTSIQGGTLARFTDLEPDANGNLYITTVGHNPLAGETWGGVNAAILTVEQIPEPSTWALGMIGAAGMMGRRWWRRARVA